MSKQYEGLAEEIVKKIGGASNISALRHCQTRLRFNLVDDAKADKDAINSLEGVVQVVESGGMFQVVIGMHVHEVFEEIEKLLPNLTVNNTIAEPVKKQSLANIAIDFVSGVFQPIIPALSGAGMVKAFMALLITFHLIDSTSQTYYILNFFADAAFAFLPMLLAYTTAKKMKCNEILAMGVAGIMLHSSWSALVAGEEAVLFFGIIPFYKVAYTSTVIPIILVILVQAIVEKWLNKIIPQAVNLVFVPMFTFIIMGTLALSILGPVGEYAGAGLAIVFNWLSTNAAWAPSVLIGGLLPLMVMFGLHHGVAPLGSMQMASLGFDSIFGPGCVCSNIAQGTAALVVAFRTRESKTKQLGISTGVTALMGITEPVLYGLNLPKKYPLIGAMIGGGLGGLYAGLTHTHRFATGSSGIPAVVLYIGDNTMIYFYNIIIALMISVAATAIVTFILSFKYEKSTVKSSSEEEKKTVFSQESFTVYAPVDGKVVQMKDIPDATFSSGVLGEGLAVEPSAEEIRAPFSGTVETVSDTLHAVGITSKDGMQVLIHVGIDTVEMNGKGFQAFVKPGDFIEAGQLLLKFDRKEIKAAGHPDMVIILLLNGTEFSDVTMDADDEVSAGTRLMHVTKM